MFTCSECGEECPDTSMSDDYEVCWNCYEDERVTELIALDII